MAIFQRFSNRLSTTTEPAGTALSARKKARHVGTALAGVFICTGAVAFAYSSGGTQSLQQPSPPQTGSTTLNLTPKPLDTSSSTKTQSSVSISSEHSGTGSNKPTSTSVTVNGNNVPVPDNGTVQRTFTDQNGQTSVNISTSTNTEGTASNSSFIDITSDLSSTIMNNGDSSP